MVIMVVPGFLKATIQIFNMKTSNYISVTLSVLAFSIMIFLAAKGDDKKIAFFMSAEVYNEFDYKKELELELKTIEDALTKSIDSLERDLQFSIDYLNTVQPTQEQIILYERQENYYLKFKQEEEYNYSLKTQEYYSLIWDRINTYVKEYGKENDHSYILGANGDGSIMYADDEEDITAEITEYINLKYSGE